MNNTTFTFAELEFLAHESPHWQDLRALLSIGPVGDGVLAAGASSLVMRGLGRVVKDGFEVSSEVRSRVDLLLRPARVVSFTRADESGLNLALALVPVAGGQTCVVSMGGPGVYEISVLKPAEDAAAQLADLIVALALEGKTALSIGPKASPGELLLSHDAGTWRLGRTADEPIKHGSTNQQSAVRETLLTWLRSWLSPA